MATKTTKGNTMLTKKGKSMATKAAKVTTKATNVDYISFPNPAKKVPSIIPVKILPKKGTTEINVFNSYINQEDVIIHSLSMVCLVSEARLENNLEKKVKLIGFNEYENFPLEEEGEEVYGVLKVNDSQLLDIEELWNEQNQSLTLALYHSQYVRIWRNPRNGKVSVVFSEYNNDTITVVQ